MRAELLTVGSELTSGVTINTNAAYLSRRLAELGIACDRHTAVGDERASLREALTSAVRRVDLLLITGGLGPTFDDITMEVVAEATQRPLIDHATIAAAIRRFYARYHRTLQRAALRQASLPRGGVPLANPIGTAPGLWLPLAPPLVIALPGVPSEMRAIMERSVLPRLRRWLGTSCIIGGRTLRTVGVVELEIQAMLRTLRVPPGVQVGLYPHLRMVDIRLTARAPTRQEAQHLFLPLERKLRRALGQAVYGTDEDTLEAVVGRRLVTHRKTLAVAESCTGGLVSDRLTDVPGSSRYLKGSVVAYHNDLKRGCLGVPAAQLSRYGAVSAPVAKALAAGVRRLAGAAVGLSITGIAGPAGGTAAKPVGLVYFGLADRRGVRSLRAQFFGDRLSIKTQAAQTALDWLRLHLLKDHA